MTIDMILSLSLFHNSFCILSITNKVYEVLPLLIVFLICEDETQPLGKKGLCL